jgi:hypothetical protein
MPGIRSRYSSAKWQAISEVQIRRVSLCEACLRAGRRRAATHAMHKRMDRLDEKHFWRGALSSLCGSCFDAEVVRRLAAARAWLAEPA